MAKDVGSLHEGLVVMLSPCAFNRAIIRSRYDGGSNGDGLKITPHTI